MQLQFQTDAVDLIVEGSVEECVAFYTQATAPKEELKLPNDIYTLQSMGMGLYRWMGMDPDAEDGYAMRQDMTAILGRKVVSRGSVTKEEWKTWIRHCLENLG